MPKATGTDLSPGDTITAAKLNKKLEMTVKRNASGAVVFSNVGSDSWTGVGTATVTHSFTTTEPFNYTRMIARLGTATTAYLTVLRNGSVIASTTVTGTGAVASITTTNLITAGLTGTNTFTVKAHFGGGTGTLTFTAQRNDKMTPV